MEFSKAAIQIVILIIPGLISYKCYTTITGKNFKKDWESFFEIIFLSITCYLLISIFGSIRIATVEYSNKYLFEYPFEISKNLQAFYSESTNPDFFEIFAASIIGIPLAFLLAKIFDKKLLNSLACKFKINHRTGRDDVWDDFLWSETSERSTYLLVRDQKNGYSYLGYVLLYSEACEKRELVLCDVTVFTTADMEKIDHLQKLYLSRNNDEIDFEIPDKVDNTTEIY